MESFTKLLAGAGFSLLGVSLYEHSGYYVMIAALFLVLAVLSWITE